MISSEMTPVCERCGGVGYLSQWKCDDVTDCPYCTSPLDKDDMPYLPPTALATERPAVLFNIGDVVVIWSRKGAGIYDGNLQTVHAIDTTRAKTTRYGLLPKGDPYKDGDWLGWMPQTNLMAENDFQELLDNGGVEKMWSGDSEKLARVLRRKNTPRHSTPMVLPPLPFVGGTESQAFTNITQLGHLLEGIQIYGVYRVSHLDKKGFYGFVLVGLNDCAIVQMCGVEQPERYLTFVNGSQFITWQATAAYVRSVLGAGR